MLDVFLSAAGQIAQPAVLGAMAIALPIGLVVGLLPGLSGLSAFAFLIPFTFGMHPLVGLGFLLASYAAVSQGGSMTAILIGVPGEVPNAATVIDGYQLSKAGRAGEAIGELGAQRMVHLNLNGWPFIGDDALYAYYFGFVPPQGFQVQAGFEYRADLAVRGVAGRIDLLEGNRLRVIDYKTGAAPGRGRALQVPVYALCAQEQLAARDSTPWTVDEALYMSFSGKKATVRVADAADTALLSSARDRVFEIVDQINGGSFPVRPHEPIRCSYCAYPSVCRKDYVE